MKFLHFFSADFLLGFFFRLTQEILQILLMYEVVFKCNKSSALVYNPNYSSCFPPGWY